ncbi:MAG: arginine decarboxylase, partial [Lentisphaeria bacterium]|nr:arginine decarboxylase [Lentisphaeria bacterium]
MRQVLIIEDKIAHACPVMEKAIGRLIQALLERNIMVIRSMSPQEAFPIIESNMDLDAFLVCVDESNECGGLAALEHIRERQSMIPVFLLGDRAATTRRISSSLMELANEFVWIYEDSPVFIAGRIQAAIERSRSELLPPLMKAIWAYNEKSHEYSWAAPGHQGGVGFTKSPVGKKFYDFYGENLFRTDTGIERSSIGSLLDHEGAFHESEVFAAKVFGADESYSVVVGTSGSNRTIMQACLGEGDLALCDRNCHKSIEQGLINTGAVPVYLLPTRNCYGIIGPIPPSRMSEAAVRKGIDSVTVPHNGKKPTYAVVTNCTYDGICYNARRAEDLLEKSVDRIHFDEAWYAYARFNPVYEDHYAMYGDPAQHKGPTVFATHSTHKLLNALSQASYIHVRHGRKSVGFDRFNQAYMMHSTTSPLYAICASNDISSAMM